MSASLNILLVEPLKRGFGVHVCSYCAAPPGAARTRGLTLGHAVWTGVALGRQGSIYVTDTRNNRLLALVPSRNTSRWLDAGERNDCSEGGCCQPECVAKSAPAFRVERLAGGQQGAANGAGAAAQFDGPAGLALAPSGELMICDSDNGLVRTVAHVPPSPNGAAAVARVRTCPLRSHLSHAPAAFF